MKEINEIIKKTSPEDLKELSSRLGIKSKSRKDLLNALTTVTGLDALLRTLDMNCHRVLKVVYESPDGVTFVEIQKALNIDIHIIEKITEILFRNLLIYITKNRQMLHSKMDKAYGILEIADYLHMADARTITDKLHKNFQHMEIQKQGVDQIKPLRDREIREIVAFIAESGCVLTLEAARGKIPARSFDKLISSLIEQNLLNLYHCYQPEFNSFLILNEKISPVVAGLVENDDTRKKERVSNRYFMINNLLQTFDVISTFGLFLTKQMEFRKIDIRRISDAMIPCRDLLGGELAPEELAQLCMFILNRLQCLKLQKDIAGISLSEVHKDLEHPLVLAKKILKCVSKASDHEEFFKPPFEMPDYDFCKTIIKLLHKLKSVTYHYLRIAMVTRALSELGERSLADGIMGIEEERERFGTAMNFLTIMGFIEIDGGRISLSDIGRDLANNMLKVFASEESTAPGKSIYINPDFTLIIPARELGSDTLYHLLTHTDIVKHDIIINAVISRASIVRAHKRGMSLEKFLHTLASNSKNELPQNMDFLLREWSSQTINMKISQAILLKTSHADFIDELLLGIAKDGIKERISDTYALVRKDYIDEIIKLARKKDAVISLFNEVDDED